MTALSDVFPDGPRTDRAGATPIDDHHTVRRLREMIGEPRESGPSIRPLADRQELIRRVDAAASDTTSSPLPVAAAPSPRRPRRRIDAWALSAGVLAVVAVAAAGTVGAVQMATASPAASSLQVLEADEAAIQNAYQALVSTRERIASDVETQTADAAKVRTALVATSTAPDPAAFGDGGTMTVVDEAALATALGALDAYVKGLAEIAAPELPSEYARPPIDEDSLTEVGSAIDGAQEQLVVLDALAVEMRGVQAQLEALRPTAETAVTAYAATFPAAAGAASDRYPDADEERRGGLTTAAAAVVTANLWEPAGVTALETYRTAYVVVAEGQLRVEIEREQQREQQRQQQNQQNQQQEEPAPDPSAPPADDGEPGGGDTP